MISHFSLSLDSALKIYKLLIEKISIFEAIEMIDERIIYKGFDEQEKLIFRCSFCNKITHEYNREDVLKWFYYHKCKKRINLRD